MSWRRNGSAPNVLFLFMVGMFGIVIVLVCIAFMFRGLLVDDSVACEAAHTLGMRECRVTARHSVFVGLRGCGDDDAVAIDIHAVSAAGDAVNAIVCCGWPWKGCTVRTR